MALATTAAVLAFVEAGRPGDDTDRIAVDQPAPAIAGTTLDGQAFDLADLRGRPVIVNFWGPSCEPCRDEFPLFVAKLAEHAADGLQIVGVLIGDPPEPARDFAATYDANWPTVVDASGAIKGSYLVAVRPQSYFVDRDGILRSIQIGEMRADPFERQFARIVGPASTPAP